jgi:hypothetical protein
MVKLFVDAGANPNLSGKFDVSWYTPKEIAQHKGELSPIIVCTFVLNATQFSGHDKVVEFLSQHTKELHDSSDDESSETTEADSADTRVSQPLLPHAHSHLPCHAQDHSCSTQIHCDIVTSNGISKKKRKVTADERLDEDSVAVKKQVQEMHSHTLAHLQSSFNSMVNFFQTQTNQIEHVLQSHIERLNAQLEDATLDNCNLTAKLQIQQQHNQSLEQLVRTLVQQNTKLLENSEKLLDVNQQLRLQNEAIVAEHQTLTATVQQVVCKNEQLCAKLHDVEQRCEELHVEKRDLQTETNQRNTVVQIDTTVELEGTSVTETQQLEPTAALEQSQQPDQPQQPPEQQQITDPKRMIDPLCEADASLPVMEEEVDTLMCYVVDKTT